MSSGCGDVLSPEDLKTAKKHQTFEAEVITGKQGGVAGGADIDYATNQVTGQVQKTMPAILRDIGFEPASFDFTTGGTLTVNDRNKAVLWPTSSGGDGNYYTWLGALPKVIPAASTPATTGGVGPGAWKNVTDQVLRSDLAFPDGAKLIGEASNIASLRSIEPTFDGQKIFLKEHTSGTRKGSGEFRAITAGGSFTDNNGTIVKTTGGAAWIRQLEDYVTPYMFGAKGDWNPTTQTGTDDSSAFQAAVDAINALGGGTILVQSGKYLVNNVNLKSYVSVLGEGSGTQLYQYEDPIGAIQCILGVNIGGGNADESNNVREVKVSNLKLIRTNRIAYTSSSGYQQFFHLISILGGTDIAISGVRFEGYNGDGIYISGGGGQAGASEVHNYDVKISGCYFYGIDWQNRNAISVIDCEGLLVEGCTFRNSTSQYQPGPIDIEPNAFAYHRLLDLKFIGNRFTNCKGSAAAAICFNIPDMAYSSQPSGFIITGNNVDGVTFTAPAFRLWHLGGANNLRDHKAIVNANTVTRCERPFFIGGFVNVSVIDNKFSRCINSAAIGSNNNTAYNVDVRSNTFNTVGSTDGRAVNTYYAQKLSIVDNNFINCGPDSGSGTIVLFNAGSSDTVEVSRNLFQNLTRTVTAIGVAGHTTDAASNSSNGNRYVNCSGNNLPAQDSDEYESQYTPVVYGNTSEGTGTYSRQLGRWSRRGKWVTFRAEIITTAHNGSGIVTVSLPTLADSPLVTVLNARAVGAGVSAQGVASGVLSTVTGSGTAGVRLQAANADASVQFAPGGVMTVYLAGTYKMP